MIGEVVVAPWGSWRILDEDDGFKVKRIVVQPHQRLSYQFHQHRAEHWTTVSGKATCVIEGQTLVLGPGQSADIEIGEGHRIGNEHDETLVLIEVQTGRYTGEDDIVRLEDDYGRCSSA